jgi:hypothetical protein
MAAKPNQTQSANKLVTSLATSPDDAGNQQHERGCEDMRDGGEESIQHVAERLSHSVECERIQRGTQHWQEDQRVDDQT